MPVPTGLNPPCAFAIPIRASLSVPDLTQVTAVSFSVKFPDGVTTATWSGSIPATVPKGVRGYESLAGAVNPTEDLLIALHTFSPSDDPQLGIYMVRPLLTVSGVSDPVPSDPRPLTVKDPFAQ